MKTILREVTLHFYFSQAVFLLQISELSYYFTKTQKLHFFFIQNHS